MGKLNGVADYGWLLNFENVDGFAKSKEAKATLQLISPIDLVARYIGRHRKEFSSEKCGVYILIR